MSDNVDGSGVTVAWPGVKLSGAIESVFRLSSVKEVNGLPAVNGTRLTANVSPAGGQQAIVRRD